MEGYLSLSLIELIYRARGVVVSIKRVATVLAIIVALYHMAYIGHLASYLGLGEPISLYSHRMISVGSITALVYLTAAVKSASSLRRSRQWLDVTLAGLCLVVPIYYVVTFSSEYMRRLAEGITNVEAIMGFLLLLLIVEATRRVMGWVMPALIVSLVVYSIYGNYLPGFLNHAGFNPIAVITQLVWQNDGVVGFVTGVGSTVVIMFILFSSLLYATGAGDFLVNLAFRLTGKYRGGPAKAAIVASMFFGMLSGATSANVAATGSVTIPLMKRLGYHSNFAGAVESVASNLGQITPPVMGAVIFVMVDWLEMSYWAVCVAAAIPAILMYIALYIYVDLEALRRGLIGLQSSELPSLKKTIKEGWPFIIPIAGLLYLIGVLQYNPETAALYSIIIAVVISMFKKGIRTNPQKLIDGLRDGVNNSLIACTACVGAGIIVTAVMLTGFGPKLSNAILAVSGGYSFIVLILAAAASYALGMGLATVPIYLILATIIAPALARSGIDLFLSHMFVIWWGLTSFITPPICTGVFTACGISGGSVWKTGFTAMRLGALTYLLPFMWVYRPGLLLIGTPWEIVMSIVAALAMVIMTGFGLGGIRLRWWQRVILIGGAILVFIPRLDTMVIGIGAGIIAVIPGLLNLVRRTRPVPRK